MTTARAVRLDQYGGIEVLHVEEVELRAPGPDEVVLEVRAAGINPGEAAIRQGFLDEVAPSTFPSGQGSDLAGVVTAVGGPGTGLAVGDEVLGYSWNRDSHASAAVVPASQLVAKPAGLSWPVAGSLYVVGATAWAAVAAVEPRQGETVVVSAAAGGVGSLAVQLLRRRGVRVVGIASERNADWLRSQGVEPVAYGDGLADRVRAVAPDGVDALIDLHGPEYVDLALELGVAPARIDSAISFARAAEVGAKTEASIAGTSREVLTELAELAAAGDLVVDVAATYPLEQVREAFTALETGHTRGKIVLVP
ncbi:NADPH:quinone reductase [Microlunatus sagamiharensis]|uniref:NADPH:quinone reductase n=1 Tax=Microlunatus sagamiharensis TaxID=546874 RepID=A0A1H2MCL4_9ACTN|nr:NADP-dependent oxidoreductase [Microlunatus sagamiharensis]SDU90206.1 NADPH:quinone reductase [Microlunatus sagamiharensis]